MALKVKTKEGWMEHVLSSVVKNNKTGCWEYQGSISKDGYGRIFCGGRKNGKFIFVHRFIYEKIIGDIPDRLLVCHTCDNPPCCNPDHLFLGTNDDNMKDMVRKGRAYKSRGEKSGMHKLTTEQVKAIRKDKRKQTEIAKEYGVVKSTICMIKNRTSRKYE